MEKYLDKTLSFEERAKDLVSRMTLDEKASQLTYHSAAVERLGFLPTIGGTRRFTGWPAPAPLRSSPRPSVWPPCLTREQMHKVGEVISTEGRANTTPILRRRRSGYL